MTRLHFLLCVMCFQWAFTTLPLGLQMMAGSVTLLWVVCLSGLQQQGIFRVPGSQVEVNDIKNSFERGEAVNLIYSHICIMSTSTETNLSPTQVKIL